MTYEPIQIRELKWLAYYYEMHGHGKEAREIRNALATHSAEEEMRKNEDEPATEKDEQSPS